MDPHRDTACAGCAERDALLAACHDALRAARSSLDDVRGWLTARAAKLTATLDRIDGVLARATRDGRQPPRRRRRSAPPPKLTAASAKTVARADGDWDVHIAGWPAFRLSPLLGRLFGLLSEEAGHDAGDGLVGYKSDAYLIARLAGDAGHGTGRTPTGRTLAQATCELRRALSHVKLHGAALLHTRRGWGRRVGVRSRGTK
jgi:hypothetical protein